MAMVSIVTLLTSMLLSLANSGHCANVAPGGGAFKSPVEAELDAGLRRGRHCRPHQGCCDRDQPDDADGMVQAHGLPQSLYTLSRPALCRWQDQVKNRTMPRARQAKLSFTNLNTSPAVLSRRHDY